MFCHIVTTSNHTITRMEKQLMLQILFYNNKRFIISFNNWNNIWNWILDILRERKANWTGEKRTINSVIMTDVIISILRKHRTNLEHQILIDSAQPTHQIYLVIVIAPCVIRSVLIICWIIYCLKIIPYIQIQSNLITSQLNILSKWKIEMKTKNQLM